MKNQIVLLVIISTFFGLSAGVAGQLLSRTYFNNFNIPGSEINIGNNQNHPVVISGASKVVVSQDVKVEEVINSYRSSLVGIFRKKESSLDTNNLNLNDFYNNSDLVSQGMTLTNDGWVITYALNNFSNANNVINNYVVINSGNKVFEIDQIVKDEYEPFLFLHVKNARDLSINKFIGSNESLTGRTVIALNWLGESFLTSIMTSNLSSEGVVQFSDDYKQNVELKNKLPQNFYNSLLVDLNGSLVGLIDDKGDIVSINTLNSSISSLLKNKQVIKPSLGVYYADLSTLIAVDNRSFQGALITKNEEKISIVKGSAAEVAGLKEGDIITAIDGVELNEYNKLNKLISDYSVGDNIKVSFSRAGTDQEVEVILGQAL